MLQVNRLTVLLCLLGAVSALTGCPPIGGEGQPLVIITSAPLLGNPGNMAGEVRHVVAGDFDVAAYLFNAEQGGWYNVPDFVDPLTSINGDGTWSVAIGNGTRQEQADVVAAFLVPAGAAVPLLSGVGTLPESLESLAAAAYYLERRETDTVRLIEFGGYEWRVNAAGTPAAPGPTTFSDSPEHVWVDDDGMLHLTLSMRDGKWAGSSLTLRPPLGHGAYLWDVATPLDGFDPNVAFSLSIFEDAAANEGLDIEFGQWGDATAQNAQFVVQPGDTMDNRLVFDMPPDAPTLNGIDWQMDFVIFRSTTGERFVLPAPEDLIADFRYNQQGIPQDQQTPAHMTLWLFDGQAPTNGEPVEVVVEGFEFMR